MERNSELQKKWKGEEILHIVHIEFVILMQYHCKVYTDFGLLILFLNALKHFKYNGFLLE